MRAMKKRVGVLLAGCGVYDGSEIHEAVITLLGLHRAGVEAICMAPNVEQHHVINHLTGEVAEGETRNVLVEAARIARGEVKDLAGVGADDLDALIIPGGFGAAKNLSRFAIEGPEGPVNEDVRRIILEITEAGKPLGLICIAPAIGAQVLGDLGLEVTIGNDAKTAAAVEQTGARHVICSVKGVHVDSHRKIISTPAYMLGPGIGDVAKGIDLLVETVVEWIS
jgi:enhancing lycopene biosynthesis protein 2